VASEVAAPVGTLVDTNVLVDILTEDSTWYAWSLRTLDNAAAAGPMVINPVIYAEISAQFDRVEDVDAVLPPGEFVRAAIPWDAAFLAGQAFVRYRRRGGAKCSPLPDFFIGAHAAVIGMRLLTRDAGRYRDYFPTVDLIAP